LGLGRRNVKREQASFLTRSDLLNPKTVLLDSFFLSNRFPNFSGDIWKYIGEFKKWVFMLTKIMKWVSLFALISATFFWSPSSNYALLLQFLVCGSASLVALEAIKSGKYLWTTAFAGLAILFNPLVAVTFPHSIFPWITALCCSMFLASLIFLKASPRLSLVSITYSGPRSEPL
jgi:hypothetical protein